MKTLKIAATLSLGIMLGLPGIASAGSGVYPAHTSSTACTGSHNGGTCTPPKATEKVVPEYYKVPTKVQHVYYDKPATQPVVTHIVHHVPVPVYGGKVITETLQGGVWTGPAAACCQPRVHVQSRPLVRPPVRVHVQPRAQPVVTCRRARYNAHHNVRRCY